jgi:hypothetical protein
MPRFRCLWYMLTIIGLASANRGRHENKERYLKKRSMESKKVKELTKVPTRLISKLTMSPTKFPTKLPTKLATQPPTKAPTNAPSKAPTKAPTNAPSKAPTKAPTTPPTKAPTKLPTSLPTPKPTKAPTVKPTNVPTPYPTTLLAPKSEQTLQILSAILIPGETKDELPPVLLNQTSILEGAVSNFTVTYRVSGSLKAQDNGIVSLYNIGSAVQVACDIENKGVFVNFTFPVGADQLPHLFPLGALLVIRAEVFGLYQIEKTALQMDISLLMKSMSSMTLPVSSSDELVIFSACFRKDLYQLKDY